MRILLHCCCGPCAIYPVNQMRNLGHELRAFYYNHIHPYSEWQKRCATLSEWANTIQLPLIIDERYELVNFLKNSLFRERDRCRFCYQDRLEKAARIAQKGKFEAFSTTLLYSKFQKHDLIREIGESLGRRYGVKFYYEDFRLGWKEGIELSKKENMYRQQYCGCIYSEGERYLGAKKLYS